MHYGVPAPVQWFAIPEHERENRALLSSDQCVIDSEQTFLVGNIDIQVIATEELFSWDVWVHVDMATFLRACDLWEEPGRETEPPFPATLATELPGYPSTFGLPVTVQTRVVGRRPLVLLGAVEHPLGDPSATPG